MQSVAIIGAGPSGIAAAKAGRATIISEHPARIVGRLVALEARDEGVAGVDAALAEPGYVRLVDELRFAPEDEALVRSLVGGALVVPDLPSAWRVHGALTHPVAIVTVDGTVLHADGRVSGGTGEEVAAGMLESKREARELGHEVQMLDAKVTELLALHQALRSGIVEAQAALDAARRKAHADELSLVSAEKDLRVMLAQQQNLLARVERVRGELVELSEVVSEADQEKAQATLVLEQGRIDLDGIGYRLERFECRR